MDPASARSGAALRALILGVLGQDGSYLAEQLLAEGHDVFGLTRRPNATSLARLLHGDLLDQDSLEAALRAAKPDVVYNLAAVTSPGGAWGTPEPPLLAEVTGAGVVRLLDAMVRCSPEARLVHASSSAVYAPGRYGLYGAAKVLAHQAVVGYADVLHCSNAVLFSHTSPRQDPRFLARRITSTIARVAAGSDERLTLGDVESHRDWGFAPDYMRALQVIGEQSTPGDWVVHSDARHSVRELVEVALGAAGLRWDDVVRIDADAPRVPDEITDIVHVCARSLGWIPETSFEDMVTEMVRSA
jgi:GDPmannose 4,6-dehydratase